MLVGHGVCMLVHAGGWCLLPDTVLLVLVLLRSLLFSFVSHKLFAQMQVISVSVSCFGQQSLSFR